MEPVAETIKNTNNNNGVPSGPPSPPGGSTTNMTFEHHLAKTSSLPPPALNKTTRHVKRLTLNFPIIPPTVLRSEQSSPSPGPMTPATDSPANPSPGRHASITLVPTDDSNDGSDLLTAIASQERKVLEIREELSRAESELTNLKKRWALSEKTRKRTEISYRAEVMKPLKSPEAGLTNDTPKSPEEHNSNNAEPTSATQARISRELKRGSSLRAAQKGGVTISTKGRRVFPGSKHTRTLSLLSPDLGAGFKPSFLQKTDTEDQKADDEQQRTRHPRSATLPSVERSDQDIGSPEQSMLAGDEVTQWRRSMPPPSREALLRTGKQMASDLREGLWTFLEDIRQATVGEEGISATESRSMQPTLVQRSSSGRRLERSVTPSRSRERLGAALGRTNSSSGSEERTGTTKNSGNNTTPADTEVSFWSEFGVDTPGQKSKPTKAANNTPSGSKESEDSNLLDVDDGWEAWNTPQPTKMHTPTSSRSTIDSKHDQSPSTQLSSPRTSASFGDWNSTIDPVNETNFPEGIPWPALSKFTASKLTRTASSLMAEWERSLTSSPDKNQRGDKSPRVEKMDEDDWGATS